jgi:ribonuclease HII
MVSDTNLSKVWSLGTVGQVTTKQAVDCAINIAEAALKRYGVDDVAELTPQKRKNLFASVDRVLLALGIKEIAEDWWEFHDWQELDVV